MKNAPRKTRMQRKQAWARLLLCNRKYKVKRAIDALNWPKGQRIDADTLLAEMAAVEK